MGFGADGLDQQSHTALEKLGHSKLGKGKENASDRRVEHTVVKVLYSPLRAPSRGKGVHEHANHKRGQGAREVHHRHL